jgi:hypothetical protein
MSIWVTTREPNAFLAAIRRAIDDGRVRTWAYDENGDLHAKRKRTVVADAYFHPKTEADGVCFTLVLPSGGTIAGDFTFAWHTMQLMALLFDHFREEVSAGIEIGTSELGEGTAVAGPADEGGWSRDGA